MWLSHKECRFWCWTGLGLSSGPISVSLLTPKPRCRTSLEGSSGQKPLLISWGSKTFMKINGFCNLLSIFNDSKLGAFFCKSFFFFFPQVFWFRIGRLKINEKTDCLCKVSLNFTGMYVLTYTAEWEEGCINAGSTWVIQPTSSYFCFLPECKGFHHIYFHNMLLSNRPLIESKLITIKTLHLMTSLHF